MIPPDWVLSETDLPIRWRMVFWTLSLKDKSTLYSPEAICNGYLMSLESLICSSWGAYPIKSFVRNKISGELLSPAINFSIPLPFSVREMETEFRVPESREGEPGTAAGKTKSSRNRYVSAAGIASVRKALEQFQKTLFFQ